MTPLALLESMCALSAEMAAAARANDWDLLASLEQDMARFRDELMRLEPNGRQSVPLAVAEATRKAGLIEAILDNERTVMSLVRPWMDSTRKLLSSQNRDRAVRAAYGAVGP